MKTRMRRAIFAHGAVPEDLRELQIPAVFYVPGKTPMASTLSIWEEAARKYHAPKLLRHHADRARKLAALLIVQRAFNHLSQQRWIAEQRRDLVWEAACRAAMNTMRKAKTRIRREPEKKAA